MLEYQQANHSKHLPAAVLSIVSLWFIAIYEGVVESESSFRCSLIAELPTAIANKSENISKRFVPVFMTFPAF